MTLKYAYLTSGGWHQRLRANQRHERVVHLIMLILSRDQPSKNSIIFSLELSLSLPTSQDMVSAPEKPRVPDVRDTNENTKDTKNLVSPLQNSKRKTRNINIPNIIPYALKQYKGI